MNKAFVILGNQLFNPKYYKDYKDHLFYMAEDFGLCTYEKHHKHKIIFFLSAMRSFRDELIHAEFSVFYNHMDEKNFKDRYEKKLEQFISTKNISLISLFEIEDKNFESKILGLFDKLKIKYNYLNSPMFMSTRSDFKNYLKKSRKPLMGGFYREQRIKHKILVDSQDKPVGGKWSFDKENRKKIPKDMIFPKHVVFKNTKYTEELKLSVDKEFKNHVGNTEDFWLGTTRADAFKSFENFLTEKINLFGDYEDALSQKDNKLFHSILSPYLNVGLITPKEILENIITKQNNIKINSFEGYVRQIIGWREFIRGIYQSYDNIFQKENFFNHKRKMKKSWYDGTTGIDPLDYSINNAKKYGWSHHIERLMILSNIMNLSEIQPGEVYKWFMEMFVDSSDWVMSPNVYGMGLFSDGGIFATKPYICGSSYIMKMMDFQKGSWCDVLDGLYWRFIEKNKDFFKKNPRLSMMVVILEKMNPERKKNILSDAERFIDLNTE